MTPPPPPPTHAARPRDGDGAAVDEIVARSDSVHGLSRRLLALGGAALIAVVAVLVLSALV